MQPTEIGNGTTGPLWRMDGVLENNMQMTLKLKFVQLDVFTSTRFLGNPLAIVHLPSDSPDLPQSQKQLIAREFNLSETVFLHESVAGSDDDTPIIIDIFTTTEELPFAGHPTVGSGWYLLSRAPGKSSITLRTKAGDIPVKRESDKVRLQVPIDFRVHAPYAHPTVKSLQPHLTAEDYINGLDGTEAVASIVKGMTFLLLQLSSEEALQRLQPFPQRLHVPGLGDWEGFIGLYAFFERKDGVVRTRMFDGTLEDPATGSAASTLAGWLAKQKGQGTWRVDIVQGVEMGRKSEIEVVVEVDGAGEIKRIDLGGGAVQVIEGSVDSEI